MPRSTGWDSSITFTPWGPTAASSSYDQPDDEDLLEKEIRALVDEARRHGGKPVAGRAQGTADILNALRGGVTGPVMRDFSDLLYSWMSTSRQRR
ncbi:hypothetical protein [Streptomyces violaceusniger]|uniref:hypothetical protein n=1 Tax=Streptomyces violaceusniger TaxID=68280 RepID=UPI003F5767F8